MNGSSSIEHYLKTDRGFDFLLGPVKLCAYVGFTYSFLLHESWVIAGVGVPRAIMSGLASLALLIGVFELISSSPIRKMKENYSEMGKIGVAVPAVSLMFGLVMLWGIPMFLGASKQINDGTAVLIGMCILFPIISFIAYGVKWDNIIKKIGAG